MKRILSTFLLILAIVCFMIAAVATSEPVFHFHFTLQNDSPVEITELRISVLAGERDGRVRPIDPLSSGSSLDTYYAIGIGGGCFATAPRSVVVNIEIIDGNGDSWDFGVFDLAETDGFVFTLDANGEAHLEQKLK